jgi:hypothetical protein
VAESDEAVVGFFGELQQGWNPDTFSPVLMVARAFRRVNPL